MLKLLLASLALTCVCAQFNQGGYQIDDLHGYLVEYDDRHDLILFVNEVNCYLITAQDSTWDQIVRDQTELSLTSSEIYRQIVAGTGVTTMTQQEASDAFHSRLEEWQCRDKNIFRVNYTWHIHNPGK